MEQEKEVMIVAGRGLMVADRGDDRQSQLWREIWGGQFGNWDVGKSDKMESRLNQFGSAFDLATVTWLQI